MVPTLLMVSRVLPPAVPLQTVVVLASGLTPLSPKAAESLVSEELEPL